MGGLDDDEAVGGPEVCEWRVAVEGVEIVGVAVAVGEKDEGEGGAGWGKEILSWRSTIRDGGVVVLD